MTFHTPHQVVEMIFQSSMEGLSLNVYNETIKYILNLGNINPNILSLSTINYLMSLIVSVLDFFCFRIPLNLKIKKWNTLDNITSMGQMDNHSWATIPFFFLDLIDVSKVMFQRKLFSKKEFT